MKTFNVRLAAILAGVFAVLSIGVFFLHNYQVKRNAGFFLEQAEAAKEKAEIAKKNNDKEAERKATKERLDNLGWFISSVPNDPRVDDVRATYGLLLAENIHSPSEFATAYSTLALVVDRDPKQDEARRKLIELWLAAERYEFAQQNIKYFLDSKPDDSEMLTNLGQCQVGLREYKKAKASYLEAIKFAPEHVDAYFRLAALLKDHPELCDKPTEDANESAAEGDKEKKEKAVENTPESVMAAMIEKNPDSSKAHRYMSRFLLSSKVTPDVLRDAYLHAQLAVQLDPDDLDSILLAVQCGLFTSKFDDARNYALEGLKKDKDALGFRRQIYLFLADIENRSKNRDKAIEYLNEGYKETKMPDFLWLRADRQIDANDLKSAKETIKELTDARYDNRSLEYLRGRIALMESHWNEAIKALQNARPNYAKRPDQAKMIEFWLGMAYGQLGNVDQKIVALQRALDIDPFFELAVVEMANVKRSQGSGVPMTLNQILLLLKNSKEPRTLQSMIPLAIAAKSQLPKEDQNWKEMEEILDRIEKDHPDMEVIPLHRCEILMNQERFDEAEKMLQGLMAKKPDSVAYWRAMAMLSILQKKFDKAEGIIANFEKAVGDTLDTRLLKIRYYLLRYGKEALPRLVDLEEKTDNFDDQQKNVLWENLLSAMRQIGARDEVNKLTKLMTERDPNNIKYLVLSFDQATEAGDLKQMEKILDNIERVEGQGATWFTNQAVLRIYKVRAGGNPALLDEALKMLEQAKDKRPNFSKIPFFIGQIYDQKKDTTRALKYYQDAIQMGEYNYSAILRVVQILWEQQRFREANEFLRNMERNQVQFPPEVVKVWVALMLHRDIRDFESALDKARKVAAVKTDDYKTQLWFGQVLLDIERMTRAPGRKKMFDELLPEMEKTFRRAVELGPTVPDTWVTLIQYLVATDQLSEAEKALDTARKTLTGKDAPLALGQCLEILKNYAQAREQFELALAGSPDDAKVVRKVTEFFVRLGGANQAERGNAIKQAETLLNRIIDGKDVKGEVDDVLWARRALAWIVLARSGYENVEKARKLVELNLQAAPESVPDISLLAYINAQDPKQSVREKAIKDLKKLRADQKASDADLYRLAQLYLNNNNWNSARELLRELAIDSIDDPQYMAIYIHELLNHGETSDADTYLNKLEEKWPNHVQTLLLQAEVAIRRNKGEEALDMMKSFIDRSTAVPTDRDQRIRLMAAAMEDFVNRVFDADQSVDSERFIRAAEKLLRQYADAHPSSAMEVVGFLARQRRFDDAVDMLEQNWKSTDPVSLHQACMLATDNGHGAPEITDRVKKILEEAKVQFENHPTILLTLGDISVGESKYKEAEEYYRDIIKDNPGHSVALNNLAVLLSLSKNKIDEALTAINDAMKITGPIAQMLDTRACVYLAQGKGDKALADMNDVIADGKQPERLFHYAQALEMVGQNNAAAVAMQEALQMGLTEKKLMKPEIPAYQRLRDMARRLSPSKDGKSPSK